MTTILYAPDKALKDCPLARVNSTGKLLFTGSKVNVPDPPDSVPLIDPNEVLGVIDPLIVPLIEKLFDLYEGGTLLPIVVAPAVTVTLSHVMLVQLAM